MLENKILLWSASWQNFLSSLFSVCHKFTEFLGIWRSYTLELSSGIFKVLEPLCSALVHLRLKYISLRYPEALILSTCLPPPTQEYTCTCEDNGLWLTLVVWTIQTSTNITKHLKFPFYCCSCNDRWNEVTYSKWGWHFHTVIFAHKHSERPC